MDYASQIAYDARYGTMAAAAPVSERLIFLRKAYLLVFAGLVLAGVVGAFVATERMVSVVAGNWWLFFIGYIAVGWFAQSVKAKPGLNLFAFFLLTAAAGALLGPLLYLATLMANGKPTYILQAVVVSGTAIAGLSGYVMITKKDFSFLRGALTIGVFALLGIVIASIFMDFSVGAGLFISGGGALLFCGFILYDTSRIVRTHPVDDYVGAAISLFLDFFLLFWYVLHFILLMAGNRD